MYSKQTKLVDGDTSRDGGGKVLGNDCESIASVRANFSKQNEWLSR